MHQSNQKNLKSKQHSDHEKSLSEQTGQTVHLRLSLKLSLQVKETLFKLTVLKIPFFGFFLDVWFRKSTCVMWR